MVLSSGKNFKKYVVVGIYK